MPLKRQGLWYPYIIMDTGLFVEDIFVLTPRDVGRRFDRVRKLGINKLERRPDVNYWFDDMSEPSCLFLSVDSCEPQKFAWEIVELTFGYRAYFRCSCGLRVSKLYLPIYSKEFKCRKCHKLQYQLSTFNKNSVAGRSLYRMNRLQKLAESRANMSRIFYNGNYTKKFERFLGLCDRAGFDSIVKDANDLKALIKG